MYKVFIHLLICSQEILSDTFADIQKSHWQHYGDVEHQSP